MSNITKENTFESYNNVDLNKRLESVSNTDIKTINTYWNNILTANEKIVNTRENKSDIQRNTVGILEANSKNTTNTVFIPLVGLVASDTGSYFQTLETDFTFFEFNAKVRTTSATIPTEPQQLVVYTTIGNNEVTTGPSGFIVNPRTNVDVLFYAPAFNGGTEILRYEYALATSSNSSEYNQFQTIKINDTAIVSYENEIVESNDKDFRYIFSFKPSIFSSNTDYILRIRAVNAVGAGPALDATFKTNEQAIRTTKSIPADQEPKKQTR